MTDIVGIYLDGAKQFGVTQAERHQAGLRSAFKFSPLIHDWQGFEPSIASLSGCPLWART